MTNTAGNSAMQSEHKDEQQATILNPDQSLSILKKSKNSEMELKQLDENEYISNPKLAEHPQMPG